MLQMSFCEWQRGMKFSAIGSNPRAVSVGIITGVIEGCDLWQESCQPKKKKKVAQIWSQVSQMSPDERMNSRGFWAEIRADIIHSSADRFVLSLPNKKVAVMFMVKGLFVDSVEFFVYWKRFFVYP